MIGQEMRYGPKGFVGLSKQWYGATHSVVTDDKISSY